MYLYLVDQFAQDKKYARDLMHIQARVQDLGMSGRFEKLTILKSIKGIVEEAERKGVKTLVAIGNDKTFNEMIAHLKKNDVTLGLIPFGEGQNNIAHALHIPLGVHACTTLSKRIIQKLDVGMVNGRFFFSSLSFPYSTKLHVECDKSYRLVSREGAQMSIVNFCAQDHRGNAQDGKLETLVQEHHDASLFSFFKRKRINTSETIVPAKQIHIKSGDENLPIYSEGALVVKTPAVIQIAPKKLRVIAGA